MSRSSPALRWGLIGASHIAEIAVGPAILAADDVIAAVYSHDGQRARVLADQLGAPLATDALGELWSAGLDAVYISSTNEAHLEQTLAAARAGCHVLCEKPLALTVADAEAMQRGCDANGVLLATNHHLRDAPGPRTVRKLIADGRVGTVRSVRLMQTWPMREEWYGWRLTSPARGAGIALDLTVHDADLLRFLLDAEVEAVVGLTANQGLADEGIDDAAMTVIRFEGGVLAMCHDAWNVPGAPSHMVINGSLGSIEVTNPTVSDDSQEVSLVLGGERVQVPLAASRGAYVETVEAFGEATRGNGTPSCSGRDGIESLRAAVAVLGRPEPTSA